VQFVGMNSAFLTAQGSQERACVAPSAAALCTVPIRAAAVGVEEVLAGGEIVADSRKELVSFGG